MNYYNENDPKVVGWLRRLIVAGHIPTGVIDDRSIEDIKPADLAGFAQCHFFAGIGGWSLALRLAGWPDNIPVWTGSCPCQPFSAAGKGDGFTDERHLWPAWFHLVSQCKPPVIFGEQVEGAIKHGWLDLVQTDLEACGYAFGAAILPAAGVGAPHIRSRGWFVAGLLGDTTLDRSRSGLRDCEQGEKRGHVFADNSNTHPLGDTSSQGLPVREYQKLPGEDGDDQRRTIEQCCGSLNRPSTPDSPWSNAEWLYCRDGKARPVEPGAFPLAHGVPARVVRLRGYGNAIVPQVAAEFIKVYMEITK